MPRLIRLLVLLALGLALLGHAAWGQDIRIMPVPLGVKPQWTPVPGAPQVYWAPNIPTDVFRYRGKYYFFWDNYFYQGNKPNGPWHAVTQVPEVFYNVDPSYFKTAKKTETPAAPGTTPPSPGAPAPEAAPPASPKAPEAAPAPAPTPPPAPAPAPGTPGEAPLRPKVM